MSFNKFKILYIFNNESEYSKLKHEVDKKFYQLKIYQELEKDTTGGLISFKKQMHDLVFIDLNIPNLNAENISKELKKIKGSVGLFFFSTQDLSIKNSLFYKLPILDWSALLVDVFGFIPEEKRIQFGLQFNNLNSHFLLNEYSKKYRQDIVNKNFSYSKIPLHFQEASTEKAEVYLNSKENKIEIKIERSKFEFVLTLITIFSLIGITYYLFKNEEYDSDKLLSLRNIFFTFSSISLGCFLLVLPLNKILAKEIDLD